MERKEGERREGRAGSAVLCRYLSLLNMHKNLVTEFSLCLTLLHICPVLETSVCDDSYSTPFSASQAGIDCRKYITMMNRDIRF